MDDLTTAAPLPAANAALLVVLVTEEEEDEAFEEAALEVEAFDVEVALEEVETASACDDSLKLEDEEEADAVGLPTGTPRPALMESIKFVYDVVKGATTEGFGKLATEPPFHLATVSSPIR